MKRTLTALALTMYSIGATPVSNDRSEQEYPYNLLGTPGYSTPAEYKAKLLRSEERMRQIEEKHTAYEHGVHIRQYLRQREIDLRYETSDTMLRQKVQDRDQRTPDECSPW